MMSACCPPVDGKVAKAAPRGPHKLRASWKNSSVSRDRRIRREKLHGRRTASALFHGPARFTPTCCECLSTRSSATQTKSTHKTHSERLSPRTVTHAGYATELAVRLLFPTTLSAPRAALWQGSACVAASSPPDSLIVSPPG